MHEQCSRKKPWDVGRLFRVKALPVYENKSRASTIAVVVNCLNTKKCQVKSSKFCEYYKILVYFQNKQAVFIQLDTC